MDLKLLVVDDDANLLDSYQRQLRNRVPTDVASNGTEAIDAILTKGPYAVIISDYRMPGMNGIELLTFASEMNPDSVRILLTGYADLEMAIDAVNQGQIFRLLTKPCKPEVIRQAVSDGLEHYTQSHSEKILLDHTLKGSLKVLTRVFRLIMPETSDRISRISPVAQELSHILDDPDPWQTAVATLLAFLGFLEFPPDVMAKVINGEKLTSKEWQQFSKHPAVASELVSKIPRMEEVARILAYQEKHYDGSGTPNDDVKGDDIPIGSRIIRVAIDYDLLLSQEKEPDAALRILEERSGLYDPAVLEALKKTVEDKPAGITRFVTVEELNENMVLVEDISALKGGKKILSAGQPITRSLIKYLKGYNKTSAIAEPIKVIDRTGAET